ncbi:MAG: leucine-rich repeat protein, partial [Treponema sp.]
STTAAGSTTSASSSTTAAGSTTSASSSTTAAGSTTSASSSTTAAGSTTSASSSTTAAGSTTSASSSTTSASSSTTAADSSLLAKRTIVTDDACLESYTVKNLVYGASYTFLVRTYDSDSVYSKGIEQTGTMPEESKGLKYKLSSDGASYYVSAFTGDDSANQTITIEQENGITSTPITVTVFSTYNNKPVTAIGSEAFKNCRNITEVNLPSTITRIGVNAFFGCTALKSIVLPENLSTISDGAFWDCVSLSYIVIPKSVTSIGLGATLNDVNLLHILYKGSEDEWNVLLPKIEKSGNLFIIGRAANLLSKSSEIRFNYDGSLPVEFTPPKKVIDLSAEQGMSHVKLSWINPNDKDFAGVEILAKAEDDSFTKTYTINSKDVDSYLITKLTNNLNYTFTVKSFDNLKNYSEEVILKGIVPNCVEKFDESTGFSYYISEDGNSCVLSDYALDSSTVIVPEKIENLDVVRISDDTFSKNESMKILILPKTICQIDENVIKDCSALEDIYYEDDLENWILIKNATSISQNVHYNFSYDENDTTPPKEVTNITVLKGDTKIGLVFSEPSDSDFYSVQITSVPEAKIVKSYNEHFAAIDLTNEQKYNFVIKTQDVYGNVSEGISVEAIAEEIKTEGKTKSGLIYKLISSNDYLSGISYEICGYENPDDSVEKVDIIIPETINDVYVTKISEDAFENYHFISSIFIPKSIELIESKSLSQSKCLNSIVIDSGNTNFCLNADGSILYKKNKFAKDIVLVLHSVSGEIDFSVLNVANIMPYSFCGCNKITSLILSSKLEKIEDYAFKDCSELKIIVLSDNVNSIGDNAFLGCEKLSVCCYSGSEEQWKKVKLNTEKNKTLANCKYIFDFKK